MKVVLSPFTHVISRASCLLLAVGRASGMEMEYFMRLAHAFDTVLPTDGGVPMGYPTSSSTRHRYCSIHVALH